MLLWFKLSLRGVFAVVPWCFGVLLDIEVCVFGCVGCVCDTSLRRVLVVGVSVVWVWRPFVAGFLFLPGR